MKPTSVVFGPPGTGKTTELLKIVDRLLSSGIQSHRVGFMAFTRKGASEAANRAMDKFSLLRTDLPFFRTIHSAALALAPVMREQIIRRFQLAEFAEEQGLEFTGVSDMEVQAGYVPAGDVVRFLENLSRLKGLPLNVVWSDNPEMDVPLGMLVSFANTYRSYKMSAGLIDFTDILLSYLRDGTVPALEVMIIDEAQDLSDLQWRVVEKMASNCKEIIVAGDDDQAIYGWSGASTSQFLDMAASVKDVRVLRKSFRVPRKVHDIALRISRQIGTRVEKNWTPRDAEGSVSEVSSVEDLELSRGTWLVLARNQYALNEVEELCLLNGYNYKSRKFDSAKSSAGTAIRTYRALMDGKDVSLGDLLTLAEMTGASGMKRQFSNVHRGVRFTAADVRALKEPDLKFTSWQDELKLMSPDDVRFYTTMEHHEPVANSARVTLSTIHGSKGGECQNVALLTEMSRRTAQNLEDDPDEEHRVFYVGVTRTSQNLVLVDSNTKHFYEI